jgi:tetratricopeptide (TPR) repeat protein
MRVNSKWLGASLLLGVMFLSGCNLPIVKKLQARDYLNKGVTQFSNQRFEAAAQLFQRSLELDPGFEIARMYLASAYMSQFIPGSADPRSEQMANAALETFKQVVATADAAGQPNINAMLSIVGIYFQKKMYDESKEWSARVLQADPTNAEAYYRIAVMDFDTVSGRTGLQGELVEFLTEEEIVELRELVDEGLRNIARAIELREGYFEAMEYQNLLWREKAKLETDEDARADLIRQADMVALESFQLRRKALEEAARKPKTAARS